MIAMAKRLLATPSPLEMAARELVQAESACEYAASMIQYNDDRISRLRVRLIELQGETA